MPKDVTIIVPAFNEEENIAAAIDNVLGAIRDIVDDYEIIVINDGSVDVTARIAEAKAKNNPHIKVIHNEKNMGYGYTFKRGIGLSTKTYISGFPGDNDTSAESLRDLMKEIGEADLVIAYMSEIKNRSLFRKALSRFFVFLMNGLFGLRLKYYNGLFIFKREIVQSIPIKSNGLAIIAECIVRMIKSGCHYKEIPFTHQGRRGGQSTALNLRSLMSVLRTIAILVKDIYFSKDYRPKAICSTSS